MAEKPYLIIGVGNMLRRDDGAGLMLAEAIRSALDERGCTTQIRQVQQLLPELAEEIGELQPHTLLVADCRADAAAGEAGQMERLTTAGFAGGTSPMPAAIGSHGLAPGDLLRLAVGLYQFAGEAWLATVPGTDFAHGEGLSAFTQEAIARLVPQVMERLI